MYILLSNLCYPLLAPHSSTMVLHQYHIVGRKAPTETEPSPQIFRMRIFAPNEVVAKSRFWYFLHQYKKMKRATGEILTVNEVRCMLALCRALLKFLDI